MMIFKVVDILMSGILEMRTAIDWPVANHFARVRTAYHKNSNTDMYAVFLIVSTS